MKYHPFANYYLQASTWLQHQIPLPQDSTSAVESTKFDWDNIMSSKHFEWHPCFGDFKCARLQLPMDWQGTSSEASKTVDLAVIKLEATVPVTDETYGGAVVTNPGGPGGSGIDSMLRVGHALRTVTSAGPDAANHTAKHFDVISFDPRGVSNTRPMLACFPNELELAKWSIEADAHGMMDTSEGSFDYRWASMRAMAEGCSKRAAENGIAMHMSTAAVARDIVEITERHGEWRERQANHLLDSPRAPLKGLSAQQKADVRSRTAYKPGVEMLQYLGFSYGTILGATLSAMYPTRIRRAVLDGVADSHDYMAGGWTTNLQDTDMIFAKLAEYCYEGGPKNCALYDKDGPAMIALKARNAITRFASNAISIPGNATSGPQVVTYNDLKLHFFAIVYQPLLNFPLTAQILHEISQGHATSLAAWKAEHQPSLGKPVSPQCLKDGPYSPSCFPSEQGVWEAASSGVLCSDGLPRLNQTKKDYREYLKKLMGQSMLIGSAWAEIQLPCTAWHARAHWRYEGDFHNKTAHPILFVGNTIDPVTPLRNAFRMASGFEGAGVLHVDAEGHCTGATTSMCSGRAVREYFQSGKLPGSKGGLEDWDEWSGYGALCGTNRVPFDGYKKYEIPPLPKGETDQELWRALISLNQNRP